MPKHYKLRSHAIKMPSAAAKGDYLLLTDPPTVIPKAQFNAMFSLLTPLAPYKENDTGNGRGPDTSPRNHTIIEQEKTKCLSVLAACTAPVKATALVNTTGLAGNAQVHHRLTPLVTAGYVTKTGAGRNVFYRITDAGRKALTARKPTGQ